MQGTKAAIKETAREMPHILVVDDEKSICELLEITFRKEGHRVEVISACLEPVAWIFSSLPRRSPPARFSF